MSDKKQYSKEESPGATHYLGVAMRAALGACEKMQRTAIEIPLDVLANMGVAEDKMNEIRQAAGVKVHELYELIDTAATKTGLVDAKPAAPSGKSAKKA